MCGVVGELQLKGGAVDPDILRGMVSMLGHRGPDGIGLHCEGPVGLGHARLSIIDLSGGAQPMSNGDGSLWITFNGEIFNFVELREELQAAGFQFATRSDTEVILHLYERYGDACVHRLNGQWAFAIWDRRRKRLFLSRDRMGERPLFYTQTGDSFVFSSEIKALFAHPAVTREFDVHALQQIFTFWVTVPPRTPFLKISDLPPGHTMVVEEGGRTTVEPYWRLSYDWEGGFDDATAARKADELLDLLTDATRIRLRSDVPVGAYLSGGIDSTVIAALIRRIDSTQLKTFSVSFDDPEYDEREYQRAANDHLRTEHAEVRCTYDDIVKAFAAVIWHAEYPLIRTAPAPLMLLSRLVREHGMKVVLTGEGSDEVLGGYDIFKEAKVRRFWAQMPQSHLRPVLLKRLYPYMNNLHRQAPAYLQAFFHARREDLAGPFFSHQCRWDLTSRLYAFFSREVKRQLVDGDVKQPIEAALPANFRAWAPLCQAQYLEAAYLLPGYILSSQGDRMAMANSVEGRYPFLDHRVVEFAAKLHPNLKLKVLNEKYLLKRAAGDLLPACIRRRPKQPYRAPDGRSFFNGPAADYVTQMLGPEQLRHSSVFDPGAVAQLADKFRKGIGVGVKDDMAMVGVLSTQLLHDQFIHNFRKRKWEEITKSPKTCVASS